MGAPLFLFGAGASIDAGLYDTNVLTHKIYDFLVKSRNDDTSRLFAYVISRIITKKVRRGHSPFENVNVEEVYESIERLVNRSSDVVSEFVSSWDPFLVDFMPTFDENRFVESISSSLKSNRSLGRSDTALQYIDKYKLRNAARAITNATSRSEFKASSNILERLVEALMKCLEHEDSKIEYMCDIAKLAFNKRAVVGSLNYDLIFESSMEKINLKLDYGLDNWNDKKLVMFSNRRADVKFIKLHGSMNWYDDNENLRVGMPKYFRNPLLIFGSGNKLRADGPFLQLRHEFERRLLSTNELVVVGYAFADEHLNSIIRRWVSTRRKAKMIVVNPSDLSTWAGKIGTPYVLKEGKLHRKSVDIVHIKKTAKNSVVDLVNEMGSPIDINIDHKKDGFLPHVLVRVLE